MTFTNRFVQKKISWDIDKFDEFLNIIFIFNAIFLMITLIENVCISLSYIFNVCGHGTGEDAAVRQTHCSDATGHC